MQIQILKQEKILQETGSPLFGFLGVPSKFKNRFLPSFCTSSAVTSMSSTYLVSFTSLDLPKLSSTCYKLVLHFFSSTGYLFFTPWTNLQTLDKYGQCSKSFHTASWCAHNQKNNGLFSRISCQRDVQSLDMSQSVCILEIEQMPKTTASLCHVTFSLLALLRSVFYHHRSQKSENL
jgi:hypothetical protein